MPTQRLSPAATCLSDKAFLVNSGGISDQHTLPTVEMGERFSSGMRTWWTQTPMNESRRPPDVTRWDESHLLIAGGYRQSSTAVPRQPFLFGPVHPNQ